MPALEHLSLSSIHFCGRYNDVSIRAAFSPLQSEPYTGTWQLSVLPITPAYWRQTPTDSLPFFKWELSSIMNPVGLPLIALLHYGRGLKYGVLVDCFVVPFRLTKKVMVVVTGTILYLFDHPFHIGMVFFALQQPQQIGLRRFGIVPSVHYKWVTVFFKERTKTNVFIFSNIAFLKFFYPIVVDSSSTSISVLIWCKSTNNYLHIKILHHLFKV